MPSSSGRGGGGGGAGGAALQEEGVAGVADAHGPRVRRQRQLVGRAVAAVDVSAVPTVVLGDRMECGKIRSNLINSQGNSYARHCQKYQEH